MKSGELGLLMAWARVVLVFSAGSATFGQLSSTTQRPSATRPVQWVLYKNQDRNGSLHYLPLSWNEASLFCLEREGNLPSPDTRLSMSGFRAAIRSAFNSSAVLRSSLWIGLHRNGSGMPLNVWEKDCCVQPDCVSLLSPADQAGKLCAKMKTADALSGVWSSAYCAKDSKDVVCEYQLDKGDTALYHTHQNATLTVESHATADNVHSAEDCMSLCRPIRLGRLECIAAVFREKDSVCEMYLGTELMTVVKTEPCANSLVMVRDLFKYSTEVLEEEYSYTNSSVRKPSPAGHPNGCSSTEQVPCFQDFLPQGVRLKPQQSTADPSCGKSAICARLDERGYALKGEVRDFQCSQTSHICHNAVATAQSQDDLTDIIQCFCETNGTQGFVMRLRVAGEPSVVAGPKTVSSHTYSCTAPPAVPDCAGTCNGYSVIGCEVSCNSREVKASSKSVLCQTGTDRRGWPLCDDPGVTAEETLTTGTTTSTKRSARLTTMPLKSQSCCKCQTVPRAHNETTTDELKAQLAKELKDELTVDHSSLSKRRNGKISAPDQRTSSRMTGFSVLFVLVVVMALIVLSDINVLFRCPCCLRKVEVKEKRGGKPHQTRSKTEDAGETETGRRIALEVSEPPTVPNTSARHLRTLSPPSSSSSSSSSSSEPHCEMMALASAHAGQLEVPSVQDITTEANF